MNHNIQILILRVVGWRRYEKHAVFIIANSVEVVVGMQHDCDTSCQHSAGTGSGGAWSNQDNDVRRGAFRFSGHDHILGARTVIAPIFAASWARQNSRANNITAV
jgi:hypothetical protein